MQLIKSPSRRDFKLALIPIANSEEESIDGFDFTENEKARMKATTDEAVLQRMAHHLGEIV